MFNFWKPKPQSTICFLCEPGDNGVLAEPVPAKSIVPDWFRELPAVNRDNLSATSSGLTVKRCMPFRDAFNIGWIIPLAATVRLEVKNGGKVVDAGWEFDREMISNHGSHQVAGYPQEPRPPCKFHNYWTIVTPKGWSCLFVPPLNRDQAIVEVFSGVVDTDTYRSRIHFPFVVTANDGVYTLPRGMPLIQVIPFRRDMTYIESEVRQETSEETADRERILRQTLASDGWYRTDARSVR